MERAAERNRYNAYMNLLKTLLFLILVPGTVMGLVPHWIARRMPGRRVDLGPGRYAAAGFWTLGGGLLLASFWQFATRGRGTPAPVDPPENLVVEGPYRFSRNPQYVGGVLILVGQLLWTGALSLLAYMAFVVAAFRTFVMLYEEPNLEKRFGAAYRRYRARVPRWL